MSVAYYIVPETEIQDFEHFVNGKALGHCDEARLSELCELLNIKPLMDFFSEDPEELAEFMEFIDEEAPTEFPPLEWFDPAEGLRSAQALIEHLTVNPEAMEGSAEILDDLKEFEVVLSRLVQENIRWHLALDF